MLEAGYERYLTRQLWQRFRLRALKLTPAGRRGYPDRLLILPHQRVVFVEVKRPGERLRKLQERRFRELRDAEHLAYLVDSIETADAVLDLIERWLREDDRGQQRLPVRRRGRRSVR